jgi:hypothetical protein
MMENEWWKNKISEDIYETLRGKEQYRPTFHGHSPQLWFRRHLVDWLAIVVETFYLSTTSQHLAVYLMDYFMDKLEVDQNHLHLLAMACLSIAGKLFSSFGVIYLLSLERKKYNNIWISLSVSLHGTSKLV